MLAGDDAVALQQQLGLGAAAARRIARALREQRRGERPAPLDLRLGPGPARAEAPPPRTLGARLLAPARRRGARRAQRRERVVGHLARPHEVPQRLLQLLGGHAGHVDEQVGEEARALLEPRPQRLVGALGEHLLAVGPGARRRPEHGGVVAEVQRDPAAAAPERARADPHDLARRAQLVQPRRRVGARAARQHVALPHLRGQGDALQRDEHLAQPVDARPGRRVAVDALPARREAGERPLVGRLDLRAQGGERGAPEPAQHLGVAPLALRAARAQLAPHQLAGPFEAGEDGGEVEPVARLERAALERAVRARPAADEALHRVRHVVEEGRRQPAGRDGAERVAVEPGVLGRDPALLAADAQHDGAPAGLELREPGVERRARRGAHEQLVAREVADAAQHVVQGVGRVRAGPLGQPLQVGLDRLQGTRIDQVAQLLLAEQLAQQVAVEGERGGAPLGVRRVALVHVGRDVVEEQGRGERRRGGRLDLDDAQLARVQLAQQVLQAGHVEHVAQALAVGLEHDRELAVALGHLEQRLRLQPLLPQRRAAPRVGARDEQRPARVLAEARAEQRAAAQLPDDDVLELVGVEQHQLRARRLVRVGEVDDDPVVGPDRVGLQAVLVADPGAQREAPGGVHAAAIGGEDAQAPVADLVAEALDHDRPVAGHDAGRGLLLAQEGEQVLRRERIEVVALGERVRVLLDGPAAERADRLAQLLRPPDGVALPERHRAGDAGGGRDHDAVARDVLDPPARRAEQEHLARPRLVDHLLVELAHAAPVGQVDREQAAVGDRAGVGDGERTAALAGAQRAGHAVPDDPRAQLAELLRRVAAVEHVEHVLELRARQLGEGVRAREHRRDQVHGHRVLARRGDGDDLLGEHVERVARHDGALDQALAHAPGDDRALEQVGAELGEDAALRGVADAVARPADALQAGGDRLGRLDLQHEVDGAHVDAELERRGGDEARQLAGLELLLDHEALLAGERPVVRAGDGLLGELVQAQGEALGGAAVVDEDDGGAVGPDLLEELGVDRGPDRLARRLPARERVELDAGLLRFDHRLHGDVDLQVERLARARVDDRAGPLGPDEEAPDLLERVLRGRQPDPLHVALGLLGQPLQRDREVRAALGLRHGVDLVHDHLLGPREDLPRLAREHEVERLGRGDEDVGRVAHHVAPVLLRRVARADADLHVGADPAQRRAQVLLHVVGERLERRDVDEPGALRAGLGDEPVERPQEGGERLARPGRSRDQRVRARGDRRPGPRLGRRRLGEGPSEPVAHLRGEGLECRVRHRHRR